jgi:hypothetical protein
MMSNVKYVENVRTANKILQFSTNGGGMSITHKAAVKGLYPEGCNSTVWYYNTGAINNILSFKKLAKIYRITYDSDVLKTFTVHQKSHGLVNLHCTMHTCGLHILEHGNAGSMFVQTVEDNLRNYTKRQIAVAMQARNLYENLLCPSWDNFHNIINMGGIRGCQVTVEDVKTALKIWGHLSQRPKGIR